MTDGGCITRQWHQTLDVNERLIDLLSEEPNDRLLHEFERLYETHSQRLPRLLLWGRRVLTSRSVPGRGRASILTSCTRHRGLQSSCWFVPLRRS